MNEAMDGKVNQPSFADKVVDVAKKVAPIGAVVFALACVGPDFLQLASGNLGTP